MMTIFYILLTITFSTFIWLVWDIAHWLPQDMMKPNKEDK